MVRLVSIHISPLAWVLTGGTDIIPLIGTRTTERRREALGGTTVHLSAEDLAEIDWVAPRGALSGERYPEEQMTWLGSER
jgi:diketogulonate reductase-like aldo/keto reductase